MQTNLHANKLIINSLFHKYRNTRRSGRYAPILLAPAEGWGPCRPLGAWCPYSTLGTPALLLFNCCKITEVYCNLLCSHWMKHIIQCCDWLTQKLLHEEQEGSHIMPCSPVHVKNGTKLHKGRHKMPSNCTTFKKRV